ncbi:Uncharacterised protein [Pseudescherichia vulneris]|nr:Uncharacterised protein [Pseudescherichia vulneris]
MATGSTPHGIGRILKWLLAGLLIIIGLAIGISRYQTRLVRR